MWAPDDALLSRLLTNSGQIHTNKTQSPKGLGLKFSLMIPPRADEGKSTLGYLPVPPVKGDQPPGGLLSIKCLLYPSVGNKLNTGPYTKSNTIIIKFVGKINNQPRKK